MSYHNIVNSIASLRRMIEFLACGNGEGYVRDGAFAWVTGEDAKDVIRNLNMDVSQVKQDQGIHLHVLYVAPKTWLSQGSVRDIIVLDAEFDP
ncbi:hypothetical protein HKX48_002886, partial [Thoreauomyces humboldtii]